MDFVPGVPGVAIHIDHMTVFAIDELVSAVGDFPLGEHFGALLFLLGELTRWGMRRADLERQNSAR